MGQPQVQPREASTSRSRGLRRNYINNNPSKKVDAATLASKLQLQEEQLELTYSVISLFIKTGLLVIALASSLKLGLASHQRINRNNEIASVLKVEREKLKTLNLRFDSLFAIGGKARLLEEQDQLIAPKSRRIIWR